jgi:hypothetical protein
MSAAQESDAKAMAEATAAAQAAVGATPRRVREGVDEAIGRAIAGVLLDKAPESVTMLEASAALANPVAKGDRERAYRAQRAGLTAMMLTLESDIVDPGFAGLIIGVVRRLDSGEWRDLGWATPAKTNRRGSPGVKAEEALWLTVEIAYLQAFHGCSLDKAIGLATDIWRSKTGGRTMTKSVPTMPARYGWGRTTVQKIIRLGERNEPTRIADARREGKAARTGNASPGFVAFRREYLATWAARLRQGASRSLSDGKRRRGTPRRK